MKQKTIQELTQGYKIPWLAKQIGVNYNTLKSQLNGNRKLTYCNELKIRQFLTK